MLATHRGRLQPFLTITLDGHGLEAGGRWTTTVLPDTVLTQSPAINRSAPCKPRPWISTKRLPAGVAALVPPSHVARPRLSTLTSADRRCVPLMTGGAGNTTPAPPGSLPVIVTVSKSPRRTRTTLLSWVPHRVDDGILSRPCWCQLMRCRSQVIGRPRRRSTLRASSSATDNRVPLPAGARVVVECHQRFDLDIDSQMPSASGVREVSIATQEIEAPERGSAR